MLVINGPALFSRRKEKSLYSRLQICSNMICSIILCALRVGKSFPIYTMRQVLSFVLVVTVILCQLVEYLEIVPSNISYE